ncbi:MAG: hypothetical protein V4665_02465 [Patescibacteria group bacterium]
MNKYLPSTLFLIRLGALLVIAGVCFGAYKLVFFLKERSDRNQTELLVESLTQKDSNENGIADWEETLWGLDPERNGEENKDFIMAKRRSLAEAQGLSFSETASAPLSENETLAREFFASIMSLAQSGNLTDQSLQAVSDAIGKEIIAAPIPDIYTKNMLTIKEDGPLETVEYYTAYLDLNNNYQGKNIGDEMTFIASALKNNDPGALAVAGAVGDSYRSFGKELMMIPVPERLSAIEVSMANNYEKVAVSIEGLTRLLDDPIVGMKALINYKKYSDLLVEDIEKLSDNFN